MDYSYPHDLADPSEEMRGGPMLSAPLDPRHRDLLRRIVVAVKQSQNPAFHHFHESAVSLMQFAKVSLPVSPSDIEALADQGYLDLPRTPAEDGVVTARALEAASGK